jgi:hypothetical protein
LIPEGEVHVTPRGQGTYVVERRDGTVCEVLVSHVSDVSQRIRGVAYVCGLPAEGNRDRSARVSALSHTPRDDHAPRLTRRRDTIIAPESVLERSLEHNEPVEADGLRVWVDPDGWKAFSHQGVRMVRAPVAAAKAS